MKRKKNRISFGVIRNRPVILVWIVNNERMSQMLTDHIFCDLHVTFSNVSACDRATQFNRLRKFFTDIVTVLTVYEMSKQWLRFWYLSIGIKQEKNKAWWWCIAWKSSNHIDCHTHSHSPPIYISRIGQPNVWVVLWKFGFSIACFQHEPSPNGIFTFSHALQ